MSQDRTKFIGGSDVAAILGISPWKNRIDIWLDKVSPREEDNKNYAAKKRGSRLEPYIIDIIKNEKGVTIHSRNNRYIDKDHDFLSCEIDAEYCIFNEVENIEIKTVHPFKKKEWGEEESDQLPDYYLTQVHYGLGITGRKICRVFALIGDDLKEYKVERDDDLIKYMKDKCIEFWNEYVLPKKQPTIEYKEKNLIETLKKLYPGTDGSVIEATDEHKHWRAVYDNALEMAKKYDSVVDCAKAHLLSQMGSACAIKFTDDRAFIRKEIKKRAYTVNYPENSYIDFRLGRLKEK